MNQLQILQENKVIRDEYGNRYVLITTYKHKDDDCAIVSCPENGESLHLLKYIPSEDHFVDYAFVSERRKYFCKQVKYYQWVLIHDQIGIITNSKNERGEKIINDSLGYFTKESPPEDETKGGVCYRWIPILETEKVCYEQ